MALAFQPVAPSSPIRGAPPIQKSLNALCLLYMSAQQALWRSAPSRAHPSQLIFSSAGKAHTMMLEAIKQSRLLMRRVTWELRGEAVEL
jgi:hypothetical protein